MRNTNDFATNLKGVNKVIFYILVPLTIDNKYVTGIRNIQDRMCIVRVSLLRLRQYPWAAMGELVQLIQSMIL